MNKLIKKILINSSIGSSIICLVFFVAAMFSTEALPASIFVAVFVVTFVVQAILFFALYKTIRKEDNKQ